MSQSGDATMFVTKQPSLCGSCSMCCKLLGVIEVGTMPGDWCPHCEVGKGCKVYDSRPKDCENYACMWLQLREAGKPISDDLRPDRCKVIVDAAADGLDHYVRTDPSRPDAWKHPGIAPILAALNTVGGKTYLVQNGKIQKQLVTVKQ